MSGEQRPSRPEGAQKDQEPRPGVWKWARELNSDRAISTVGGTPIAILGGFSLSNAVVAANEPQGVWREIAIACFGVAVTFLICALLFILMATRYTSSPRERLEWEPEARWQSEKMEDIRRYQRQDKWLLERYFRNIAWATTIGIAGALLGMAALLVSSHISWAVIFVACLLSSCSALAVLANFQRPRWIFPRPENAPDAPLPVLTPEEWEWARK
ncbi:hypothetical protein HEK616_37000 [Streptomyces nigrescens]|uniref:Integral membrane protein n=2 Tax=Streptomyces TaxID=1883 RepID=A0ABN6QVH8_STRNI|nr:hypothetical protein [Streptomyces nigrescens]MEE4423534.1 hypothetical protein [Streptomyces sp. DSM 41528]BDM70213.1 hypothetical protein HEK616_37000 [Streptomyces nigrescens]